MLGLQHFSTTTATPMQAGVNEIYSDCYVKKLATMQGSLYSFYDDWLQVDLELAYEQCVEDGPTAIQPSLDHISDDLAF